MATHVLEFELGAETYCVSIDYVAEIVDVGEVTAVPNAPPSVRGVMDLRGRTTAIVDPTVVFDIDADAEPRRVVVFEPEVVADGTPTGWLVDEVTHVVDVDHADLDDAPGSEAAAINGVLKRDGGEFAIWVDPGAVHAGDA